MAQEGSPAHPLAPTSDSGCSRLRTAWCRAPVYAPSMCHILCMHLQPTSMCGRAGQQDASAHGARTSLGFSPAQARCTPWYEGYRYGNTELMPCIHGYCFCNHSCWHQSSRTRVWTRYRPCQPSLLPAAYGFAAQYVLYGQGQHSTPALRGKTAKACIVGAHGYGYKVGALGMVRYGRCARASVGFRGTGTTRKGRSLGLLCSNSSPLCLTLSLMPRMGRSL